MRLQIRALVGRLGSLVVEGEVELKYDSHVTRLLGKLPSKLQVDFRKNLYFQSDSVYALPEFSKWLSTKHGVRVILNRPIKEILRTE